MGPGTVYTWITRMVARLRHLLYHVAEGIKEHALSRGAEPYTPKPLFIRPARAQQGGDACITIGGGAVRGAGGAVECVIRPRTGPRLRDGPPRSRNSIWADPAGGPRGGGASFGCRISNHV